LPHNPANAADRGRPQLIGGRPRLPAGPADSGGPGSSSLPSGQ
jgi:hypothetical protein